jgi:hypothetical protein
VVSLIQQYSRYNEQQIKGLLKNSNVEIRFAAAYVVGEKKAPLPHELIELLSDSNTSVQQASRRSLILLACQATGAKKPCEQLTRQVNSLLKFGPEPTGKQKSVGKAVNKWTAWWDDNDPQLVKLASASRTPQVEDVASEAGQTKPSPSTSKVAPEPQDPEQAAQAKLKLAKMLARDGLEEKARTHYQEIIQQYARTKAAAEARKLLETNQTKTTPRSDARKK